MAAPDPVIGSDKKRLEDYPHYNRMDETLRNAAGALSISADGGREGSDRETSRGDVNHNPPIDHGNDEYMEDINYPKDGYEALERREGGHVP